MPTQSTTGPCRKQGSRKLCWKASTDTNNVFTSQGKVLGRTNIPMENQSVILATVADFSTEITSK